MVLNPKPVGPRPSRHKPHEIRTYKRVGDVELKAHIFFPEDFSESDKRPAFVFFHPGGWEQGEPEWGYGICHRYASLGMVAISFQYRLSSMGGFSPLDGLSDVRSAIKWTRQEAGELGIDPARVVAGGISAGAHLAACAAVLREPADPGEDSGLSPMPDALVLQSAPVNPVTDTHFKELLQEREKPENCSPAHHVRPGLPPMCFIHGTADEIVPFDSVKEFAAGMREAGNRCELHPFEGTDHFFTNNPDPARVWDLIDRFLADLGYL